MEGTGGNRSTPKKRSEVEEELFWKFQEARDLEMEKENLRRKCQSHLLDRRRPSKL
jgi:hypothetical protein